MKLLQPLVSVDTAARLGLTLAHSLWQAIAVAVLLGIALRALHSWSPRARYFIALSTLGLLLVTSALTFAVTALAAGRQPAAHTELPHLIDPQQTAPVQSPAVPLPNSPRAAVPQSIAASLPQPALSWIAIAWGIGVVVMGFWQVGEWIAVQRLRSLGVQYFRDEDRALQLSKLLARRLQLKRPVHVGRSLRVNTPLVIGWLRPLILLPAAVLSGLAPEQLEAILAHELAHVRRHDYLFNLLQVAVETLMFYHPAVWWISRRVRLEREQCCDDIAVTICGDRGRYVESLAALEEIRLAQHALAMAARGAGGAQLLARARRLLESNEDPRRPTSARATFCSILLVSLALGLFRATPRLAARAVASEAAAGPSAGTTIPTAPQRLQFRLVAEQTDAAADADVVTGPDMRPMRVLKIPLLDERDLARAYPTKTAEGGSAVGVEFTAEGARRIEKLTSANIGRRLAIIFDGKLISAPTIRSPMSKSAMITPGHDGFTAEQVFALWEAMPAHNGTDEARAELEILKLEANDLRVRAAEIQAKAKHAEHERIKKLHQEGAVTDGEVEKARADAELAELQLQQEKQELAIKLAKVRKQQLLLDHRTSTTSP